MLTHSIRLPTDHGLTRIEYDLLGDLAVPASAYYGVQTARALNNFQITGIPLSHFPNFVRALAMMKKGAARTNGKLGLLPKRMEAAIGAACDEVITRQWRRSVERPLAPRRGSSLSTRLRDLAVTWEDCPLLFESFGLE